MNPIVAAHTGPANDQPRIASQSYGVTRIPGYPKLRDAGEIKLGPDVFAASQDGRSSRFPDGELIAVDEGSEVLGVRHLHGQNAIITRSAGGINRQGAHCVGDAHPDWVVRRSGVAHAHPVEPWIVGPREGGRIEIGHLVTGDLIATIQGAP